MPNKLDPAALSIDMAIKVLKAAGAKHVTREAFEQDMERGAPANRDGTINLVHYAAWLVKEMGHGRH